MTDDLRALAKAATLPPHPSEAILALLDELDAGMAALKGCQDELLDANDELDRLRAIRDAARTLADSAVLVPMEQEDDDGPAEVWCVHPDPLFALRAALAAEPKP